MADAANAGVPGEVEQVFRQVSGRAVATLIRIFGDITLAEDAVQDAFVVAAVRWGADGIPPNPAGWIVTTARNRAIDQLRRKYRGEELTRNIGVSNERSQAAVDETEQEDVVIDDQLRLIFTCCHPALATEHQVALTLRLLGGLSVPEIARAFLVGESAMAKRLGRAKYKIKAANIPYRVPGEADLSGRLKPVLAVLYLIYNAGTENLIDQAGIRREAIRLARELVRLLPSENEPAGLLALMLLNESRVASRATDGGVVLLRDQDRSAWDRQMITEGHAIVKQCIRDGRPGPYQLQAAIQAVHCAAESFAATDWNQIVGLYDHLIALSPSPVIELNRAIAVSETDGPERGLDAVDRLTIELDNYYPFHAARATMLRQMGRRNEARDAYQRASSLATSGRDRDFLVAQIDLLD